MKIILSVLFLFLLLHTNAQLVENFSDGNLTENPQWIGDTAFWKVNTDGQLQSNCAVVNQMYSLKTLINLSGPLTWTFDVSLSFNTSSANYVDVYLMATDTLFGNGYFIRIGNTDDEIALYRKTGSAIIKLIDGENGILNRSSSSLEISISRTAQNEFILKRKLNGGALITEGSVTDNTILNGNVFGFQIKQSTSSF